ncbi:MAG: hypothetical protein ACWGQW_08110 [bacterium]
MQGFTDDCNNSNDSGRDRFHALSPLGRQARIPMNTYDKEFIQGIIWKVADGKELLSTERALIVSVLKKWKGNEAKVVMINDNGDTVDLGNGGSINVTGTLTDEEKNAMRERFKASSKRTPTLPIEDYLPTEGKKVATNIRSTRKTSMLTRHGEGTLGDLKQLIIQAEKLGFPEDAYLNVENGDTMFRLWFEEA